LLEARTGATSSVAFPHFLTAYEPLFFIPNVRTFAIQAKAFQLLVRGYAPERLSAADSPEMQALAQCLATIVYAQLIAENAQRLHVPIEMVAAIFHTLVQDLGGAVLSLASCRPDMMHPFLLARLIVVPRTRDSDWEYLSLCMAASSHADSDRSPSGAGRRVG
jgi:hypothetical protein